MYKLTLLTVITLLTVVFSSNEINAQKRPWLNSKLPVSQRVDLLMKEMTLEEKVMQLQNRAFALIENYVTPEAVVDTAALRKMFPNGIGGLNLDINLDPAKYVKVVNQIQQLSSSLGKGIPVMFIGEGLHGYMGKGATVFPQAIAMGCTWDTALARKVFEVTALEARSRGVRVLLSPVLDLAREPRFGRTEEMYSEDPYLISELGKAAVVGFQGNAALPDTMHCAATLKHYVGHGEPEGGRNTAPVNISTYDLLNAHLFPFERIISSAHPVGVMPSYNEINGVPNHANHWLLSDVLRKQLGFNGLLFSDQNALDELYRQHAYVKTDSDAALLAINNGIEVDIEYYTGTFTTLAGLVKSGRLPESTIDNALRKVLTLKFNLDLFDHPYSHTNRAVNTTNSLKNQKVALEAAEKSMVLLKNQAQTLPFSLSKVKKIAVIGPLAKGVHFGGYSVEPRVGVDVLTGITSYGKGRYEVMYAEGCKIALEEASFWKDKVQTPNTVEDDKKLIAEAVEVAGKCDVVVLALGEHESFSREAWAETHRGDRSSLDLIGLQDELTAKILATGKPVVVVMFGGRPLSFKYVAQNVPAIIQAFYLGQETGNAVANVIFGDVSPSGKLSVTIPKSVGELPCYYNRKPLRWRSYINEENTPLFPFGYGLSYTTFTIGAPILDKKEIINGENITVKVDVTNIGNREGTETVQLYIRDLLSSGVRPIMELKDFAKVTLKPGEKKSVQFIITPDKLMFYNYQLQKVLEPGEFKVMVGADSQNTKAVTFLVK